MTEEEKYFHLTGEQITESIKSQLFGKPCYKISSKAFVCFFQNEMVFKLKGDAHKEALNLEGAKLFDPSGKGRAMKEWVQVSYEFKAKWLKLTNHAVDYVGKGK